MKPENKMQEKVVISNPSLESEVNSARISALELKLETLSIITESLWNILDSSGINPKVELKDEMAKVISLRAERDAIEVHCGTCNSLEKANSDCCHNCGGRLNYSGEISPFDY